MNLRQHIASVALLLVFSFTSAFGYNQTTAIKIKFIGNCGLHLTDGDLNIYVDFPYKSGAFNYMTYEQTELDSIKDNSIFLFTHKHPDHYSIKHMRKTLRKKQGKKYGKWNLKALEQLSNSIADFNITPIETNHSLSFTHYSYLLTWHGKRFYFYGDTETPDIALTQTNLDWAFIPYWTAIQLNERNVTLDAKKLGIYHYYPNMLPTTSNPDRIKLLIHQGEMITIPY